MHGQNHIKISISLRINQASGSYGAMEAHFHAFVSHKQFIQAPRAISQGTALLIHK